MHVRIVTNGAALAKGGGSDVAMSERRGVRVSGFGILVSYCGLLALPFNRPWTECAHRLPSAFELRSRRRRSSVRQPVARFVGCQRMSRIRVLMLITDLNVGGTPLDVYRLATSLPRDRFEVLVVSLADEGPIGERLRNAGIAVAACRATSAWNLPAAVRLYRFIRGFRPNVLHSLLFHANVAARVVGPAAGVPRTRILSTVLTVERKRRRHLVIENMTCRLCRVVVGNSQSVVRHLHRAAHVPPSRLRLIQGGVDVNAFIGARPADRKSLGVPEGVPIVLWVGRLDPVKGLDELIEASAIVAQEMKVAVLLAGEGGYEAEVRRQITRHGVEETVRLLGRRDDIPALLAAADVFAFPSYSEGFPNALLEAMAAGKPIVATDVPGNRDMLRHGESAWLVPARHARALANGLVRVLGDETLRSRLGSMARERVRASWPWSRCALRWQRLYEAVSASSPVRRT